MVQEIYCDEAGYTGPNLLDDGQPMFTYAGVAINKAEAEELRVRALFEYGRDVDELKCSELLKSPEGRRAIDIVVQATHSRVRFATYHKRYSLAGKFYEYTFEPVLAERGSVFYESQFNHFIQQIVYLNLLAEPGAALPWMRNFQEFVRRGRSEELPLLISNPDPNFPPLQHIVTFLRAHQATIMKEIDGLRRDSGHMNPWVLDLTMGGLYSILCAFGRQHEEMAVLCDDSAPIRADGPMFNVMVGRKERRSSTLMGVTRTLTFNLSAPIALGSSKHHPGLQIADICAGALNYSLRDRAAKDGRRWRKLLLKGVELGVLPSLDEVDLRKSRAFAHGMVLYELARRAEAGIPAVDGAKHMVRMAHFAANSRALNRL